MVCDRCTGSRRHTHWSLVVSRFQGIEQLKKEERRWAKKTKWMNMRAVFGHPFSILWFSPFSTPDHGKAETYQYVVWELSAGNQPAGSKPNWAGRTEVYLRPSRAQPSPAELSYGSPFAPSAERDCTVTPTLTMDTFFIICFLCCQQIALYFDFHFCLERAELQRKRNTVSLWILLAKHSVINVFFPELLFFCFL